MLKYSITALGLLTLCITLPQNGQFSNASYKFYFNSVGSNKKKRKHLICLFIEIIYSALPVQIVPLLPLASYLWPYHTKLLVSFILLQRKFEPSQLHSGEDRRLDLFRHGIQQEQRYCDATATRSMTHSTCTCCVKLSVVDRLLPQVRTVLTQPAPGSGCSSMTRLWGAGRHLSFTMNHAGRCHPAEVSATANAVFLFPK